MSPHIFLILFAFLGFLIAFYIFTKKQARQALVCPVGSNCEVVINSQHAKFLGIPVERLGMIYYGFIIASYGILFIVSLLSPKTAPAFLVGLTLFVTAAAFLFSIYLTLIQALAIREWCAWCLTSAALCTIIFLVTVARAPISFVSFLSTLSQHLAVAHLFAIALGIGAVTVANIFIVRFLRDMRISKEESDSLHILSQILFAAFVLLAISHIARYIIYAQIAIIPPLFLIKSIILLVIAATGLMIHLALEPRLFRLSAYSAVRDETQKILLKRASEIIIILSALSISSWYIFYFLNSDAGLEISPRTAIWAYILLFIGVSFLNRIFRRRIDTVNGNRS